MKRILIVFALVLAMSLVLVSAAYANFGPHGGYVGDTDACAGCHRAHTSFSTVGWKDQLGTDHASALLVGNATTMTEFCEACHGDTAPGAATNVASGVFDSGPSTSSTGTVGGPSDANGVTDAGAVVNPTSYHTASTFNAPLNGGGFNRMPDFYVWSATPGSTQYKQASSAHKMDVDGPLWGAGSSPQSYGGSIGLTCTDCHDPHGSSNYRLLKDEVNNVQVGGYTSGDVPTPYVFSDEQGYPLPTSVGNPGAGDNTNPSGDAPNGGWLKHQEGANQMALYYPNYTDTTGTPLLHAYSAPGKSISAWCAACHQNYNVTSAGTGTSYSYDPYLPNQSLSSAPLVGTKTYHRHAVDVTLVNGEPSSPGSSIPASTAALTVPVKSDQAFVPLEQNGATPQTADTFYNNYMGCLTCHRAHGSSVDMTGFAAAHLATSQVTTDGVTYNTVYVPVRDGIPGVDPDKGVYGATTTGNGNGSSELLRANNRGVCERCHNK